MAHRQVLVDTSGPVKMSICEGQDAGKLIVEGKVGQCDLATANGRIYTRKIMEREIGRLQPKIDMGALLGAVDHPGDGKSRIRDAGQITRKLWIETDGSVMGRFEIVEEAPAGQALAAFLRRGAAIGMSSRGVGSTSPSPGGKGDVVGEDFRLAGYDFVAEPACGDAYPKVFSEDIDTDAVTEDALRGQFPALIEAIEAKAFSQAQDTLEIDIREDVEKEFAEAISESRPKIREEEYATAYEQARADLREDFAVQLVRALQTHRRQVEEVVRSELSSDPEVAGARMAMEQVARLVAPYTPSGQVLGEQPASSAEVEELRRKLNESYAARDELAVKSRRLAFNLFVEQELAGRDDADQVRELIGSVDEVETAEELQAKVEAAVEAIDYQRTQAIAEATTMVERDRRTVEHKLTLANRKAERASQRERTVESKLNALESKIATLMDGHNDQLSARERELAKAQRRIDALEGKLTEALDTGEKAALMAYAARRAVGHPHEREIMEAVSRGDVLTEHGVNDLAESLDYRAHEPGGVNERVRRSMSRGMSAPTEVQRAREERGSLHEDSLTPRTPRSAGGATPVPNLEHMDFSMEDLQAISAAMNRRGV